MQYKYSPKYCHFLKINSNTSSANLDSTATVKQSDVWMKHLLYNRDIARRMQRKSKIIDTETAQAIYEIFQFL